MAKEKHYKVVQNTIIADMGHVTAQELKEIKAFMALGFNVIHKDPPPKPKVSKEEKAKKKAENDDARVKNPYSKKNVENFLQSIDPTGENEWKTYSKLINEKVFVDRSIVTPDGEIVSVSEPVIVKKTGEHKVKGFINGLSWFRKKYEYNQNTKTYEKKPEDQTTKETE